MLYGNVLITGGTGTLGRAIVERATKERWPCQITILSRDTVRQQAMRRDYPLCRYVLADVCNRDALHAAMVGHDLVIHAAAIKFIPECERDPVNAYAINVQGSLNVLYAAVDAGVKQIIAIGTDKEAHAINSYGATKLMMSRMYQQLAERLPIQINLCRYGNVLGSNGSVLQVWADAIKHGDPCIITDRAMTRFWLSAQQAVDLIVYALNQPSGTITIPKLPALPMGLLLRYVYGAGVHTNVTGLRPGEKLHEELLTPEESPYAELRDGYYHLYPTTSKPVYETMPHGYTSNIARELTRDELRAMLDLPTDLATPG